MLSIKVVCVGKLKEDYLRSAVLEYSKRLSRYCRLEIVEISDEKLPNKLNDAIISSIREKECGRIVSHLKRDSYVFCLDLHGNEFSSEEFSNRLNDIALNCNSCITFVIGGTLGLNSDVLSLANSCICFSKMTFPHQLIRVFLLEQLFRAFKISNNEIYHW